MNKRHGDRRLNLPITSERLILRRFMYADVPDLLEFGSHPSVAQEIGELGNTDVKVREYIDMQNSFQPFEKEKVFDLAIELKEAGKVIGLLTLITKNHHKGEIGYALGINYRGKGYATEAARTLIDYAFSELEYHRVQAIASSGNPVSWKVMERLGMKLEGRLREANFREGAWCDLLYYGILEHEWRSDYRKPSNKFLEGEEAPWHIQHLTQIVNFSILILLIRNRRSVLLHSKGRVPK